MGGRRAFNGCMFISLCSLVVPKPSHFNCFVVMINLRRNYKAVQSAYMVIESSKCHIELFKCREIGKAQRSYRGIRSSDLLGTRPQRRRIS